METEMQQTGATSELKQLNPFVGKWRTVGKIRATESNPAILIEGVDTYEWLPGGYFMLHRVDVRMGDEQIDSVEIIGYDPGTNEYAMHYFGHQGNTGVMMARVDGNIWTFTGKTERFTGSFNPKQTEMSGIWERSANSKWEPWMEIKLTKTIN